MSGKKIKIIELATWFQEAYCKLKMEEERGFISISFKQ
jgi:hypothetical protein